MSALTQSDSTENMTAVLISVCIHVVLWTFWVLGVVCQHPCFNIPPLTPNVNLESAFNIIVLFSFSPIFFQVPYHRERLDSFSDLCKKFKMSVFWKRSLSWQQITTKWIYCFRLIHPWHFNSFIKCQVSLLKLSGLMMLMLMWQYSWHCFCRVWCWLSMIKNPITSRPPVWLTEKSYKHEWYSAFGLMSYRAFLPLVGSHFMPSPLSHCDTATNCFSPV